ncbi:MAG: DUF5668 domain-containing protein [Bacteroidota bacterium]|nr:DUF5668 domain-containing protein [Bacteroidota bacterium]MDP4204871.1 DUF5668 domain-containing protein [Bacteroidota bacterium]
MNRVMEKSGRKRSFWGVIFIICGLILLLKQFNLIPIGLADFLITWKMLLVVIGLANLISGNRTGGIILILIGGFFILPDLVNVPDIVHQLYWPLGLIIVGILILTNRQRCRHFHRDCNFPGKEKPSSLDEFDDFLIFGGREQNFSTDNLKGGKLFTIFGGFDYNLTRCKPVKDGASIEVFVMFGGVTLNVPPDWVVKNDLTPIFGGFSDSRLKSGQMPYDPEKTLVIKGFCMFGGVSIESKGYFLS